MRSLCTYPIICCIFVGFLLMSCATSREKELLEIHDTVTVIDVDTIREYIERHHTDTVREKIEHIVTVNGKGDTIRETNNYYYNEHVIEQDSSSLYRHFIDSLMKSLNKEKEEVVKKKPTLWERLEDNIIFFVVMVGVFGILVLRAHRRS